MKSKLIGDVLSATRRLFDNVDFASAAVYESLERDVKVTATAIADELRTAASALESSGPYIFPSSSGGIGPDEAAILRESVIQARDFALEQTRFTDAVTLSHAIAFMEAAGEYIWGVSLEALRKENRGETSKSD